PGCPAATPGGGAPPYTLCRSDPQIEAYAVRSRISPSAGDGRGTSVQTTRPTSTQRAAFINGTPVAPCPPGITNVSEPHSITGPAAGSPSVRRCRSCGPGWILRRPRPGRPPGPPVPAGRAGSAGPG